MAKSSPNPEADIYFTEGCGRCPLMSTPACKVNTWRQELQALRKLVLASGLTEERKWGVACYTWQKSNVVMISAVNDYCAISFLKGALLTDTHKVLSKPGEHSQSARLIRFTSTAGVAALAPIIKAYINEAIEAEKAGMKVQFKKNPEPISEELQQRLNEQPALKKAFEALTPGRQRGYIIHFSQPKKPETRFSRIEKCTPRILAGKGMLD